LGDPHSTTIPQGEKHYPFTISIDDSDSPWGGCTTHLATILLTGPLRDKILLVDYPLLVRLNPSVPRKTRGNAAVVLRGYSIIPLEEIAEIIHAEQSNYSNVRPPGKEPGLAVYPGLEPWRDPRLRFLYKKAVSDYIPITMARRIAYKSGVSLVGGSGIVGSLSSLAALAPWDPYTYELIAYRKPENIGKPRCVRDPWSVEARIPSCGNANTDHYNTILSAAPGGPDPVLAGFRGREAWCLSEYKELLCEESWGWTIYRSNQHTGIHAIQSIGPPRPYKVVRVKGIVKETPKLLPKGHVLVSLETAWGTLTAAFYRETGPLRDAARLLEPGDYIIVEASVVPRSQGLTLSVEAMEIRRLAVRHVTLAPRCPSCGRRMKSMGRGKGYKCPSCGLRDPQAKPLLLRVPRRLVPGRVTASVSGARHLTRFPWFEPNHGLFMEPLPPTCFSVLGESPPPLSTPTPNC